MPVFWTIQAQRHLRHALAEALGRESDGVAIGTGPCSGVLEVTLDHLNELLALTFPGASVVVKDQVLGYRRKKDLFILLVEAFGSDEDQTGPFVVKIGAKDRLEKEIEGWNRCRPPGLKHDLVFLNLRVGPTSNVRRSELDEPRLRRRPAIPRGDGHRHLRRSRARVRPQRIPQDPVDRLRDQRAIRADRPLALQPGVRRQPRAPEASPSTCPSSTRPSSAGRPTRRAWPPGAMSTHWPPAESSSSSTPSITCGTSRPTFPGKSPSRTGGCNPGSRASDRGQAIHWSCRNPKVTDLIPRMLRGCAHGDLHGRNILVGIVRDQAMWPTVFDYEDMGPRNLIGWDFVKLETELKIRAYRRPVRRHGRGEIRSASSALRDRAEPLDRRMPPQSLLAGSRRHRAHPRSGSERSCS